MCHDIASSPPAANASRVAESIEFPSDDGFAVHGYFAALDANVATHCIVLVHDVFGASEFYRQLADRYADRGLPCLLVDVYSRQPAIDVSDRAQVNARRAALDQQLAIADCAAASAWLRSRGAQHVTILGFCMGGTLAIIAPARASFDASVVFYGLPRRRREWTSMEPISAIDDRVFGRVPMLGFWGDRDDVVGVDNVVEFDRVLTGEGVPHEFHLIPGLPHSYLTFTPGDAAYEVSLSNFERSCNFALNTTVQRKPLP
jgi:carboxymethylenebutenolidase